MENKFDKLTTEKWKSFKAWIDYSMYIYGSDFNQADKQVIGIYTGMTIAEFINIEKDGIRRMMKTVEHHLNSRNHEKVNFFLTAVYKVFEIELEHRKSNFLEAQYEQ